jgi:hypothetical protein
MSVKGESVDNSYSYKNDDIHASLLNVAVEWSALRLCIVEVPGSSLGLETRYSH